MSLFNPYDNFVSYTSITIILYMAKWDSERLSKLSQVTQQVRKFEQTQMDPLAGEQDIQILVCVKLGTWISDGEVWMLG